MKQPLVSIVISAFNDLAYIKNLIRLIKKNTIYKNYEIIIIDNGSKDFIKDYFDKNKFHNLTFLSIKKNIGFGRANNIAMNYAKGKYIAFLNSDTIPQPHWLDYLVKTLEIRPDIGIARGCEFGLKYIQEETGAPETNRLTFYETAHYALDCGLYRRELSKKNFVGGFDPNIFLYCEDADLCYRIQAYGYKVVIVPQSVLFHGRYLKDNKKIKSSYSIINRNRIFTYSSLYINYKWFGKFNLLIILLKIIISMNKQLFLQKDLKTIKGRIIGIMDFLKNFSLIYSSRRENIKTPYFKGAIKKIKKLQKQRITNKYLYIGAADINIPNNDIDNAIKRAFD